MPSNNKTPKLGLHSWVGSDKPLREDFVADNTILDTKLGAHLEDTVAHLTQADRQFLQSAFLVEGCAGDGGATTTHIMPFTPSLVLFFRRDKPLVEYDATKGCTVCHAGLASPSFHTAGISLAGDILTVQQSSTTPSDNIWLNLNENYAQYAYVAFR